MGRSEPADGERRAHEVMVERWRTLSGPQRVTLVVAMVSDVVLKLAALRDLRRRPSSQVRGPKWAWLPVILTNSAGLTSAAYLAFGRKRP